MNTKKIIGIIITGKDREALGMTEEEIDAAIDARIEIVEAYKLVGGGVLLDPTSGDVDFAAAREDDKPVTVKNWLAFSDAYRAAFPLFEGHIDLTDLSL